MLNNNANNIKFKATYLNLLGEVYTVSWEDRCFNFRPTNDQQNA